MERTWENLSQLLKDPADMALAMAEGDRPREKRSRLTAPKARVAIQKIFSRGPLKLVCDVIMTHPLPAL